MSGKLITISGIDGSGKSTLASSVERRLRSEGEAVTRRYLGWRQFSGPGLGHAAGIVRKLGPGGARSDGGERVSSRPSSLFRYLVFTDYTLDHLPSLVANEWRNTTLIADRFLFDVAINTGIHCGLPRSTILNDIHRWYRLFPEPDVQVMIDVPASVAYERKDDVPSPEYLVEHRELFRAVADHYAIPVIDGTMDPGSVEREFFRHYDRAMR